MSMAGSLMAAFGIFLIALHGPYVPLILPLYTTPKAPLPNY
jgi:hypothetical protein